MESKKEQTDRMMPGTVQNVPSSSKPGKRPWKSPVIMEEHYRNTQDEPFVPALPGAPEQAS